MLQTQHSIAPLRLDQLSRTTLQDYFDNTWALYDWLFASITAPGTLYQNPDPLRHPLIFYLGHTAAFYINKLVAAGLLREGLNERYEVLFARGVDPAAADDLDSALNWPDEEAVHRYRRQVYEIVSGVIQRADLEAPVTPAHPLWSLLMAIEHDRIHFETSSVLIRQYPEAALTQPEGWVYAPYGRADVPQAMIYVPPGRVVLGKDQGVPTFGWDNEYGRLVQEVPGFEASRTLITNAAFMAFLEEGGYEQEAFWTDEGWRWRTASGTTHPRFWVPDGDGGYRYRAMFNEMAMPLHWPAEVNAHEAAAYCRWMGEGFRLMREAEFRLMAASLVLEAPDVMFTEAFNLNLMYGSPSPVGMLTSARSPLGFEDVYGNVWNWLADDFYPLPGYAVHPLYDDFSAPYFDDQHAMLLGGSWATTGAGASRYYRLWFRRHFFQHAGFRIARDG